MQIEVGNQLTNFVLILRTKKKPNWNGIHKKTRNSFKLWLQTIGLCTFPINRVILLFWKRPLLISNFPFSWAQSFCFMALHSQIWFNESLFWFSFSCQLNLYLFIIEISILVFWFYFYFLICFAFGFCIAFYLQKIPSKCHNLYPPYW